MASYFLDSSAITKCYAPEIGRSWVKSLCSARPQNSLIISELALIEVVASLCCMARENPPRLTVADAVDNPNAHP